MVLKVYRATGDGAALQFASDHLVYCWRHVISPISGARVDKTLPI